MTELAPAVLSFEAFPDSKLHLWLFENVSNAQQIKEQIVAKQIAVDAAFLDADLVPTAHLTHLAAFKALAAQVRTCALVPDSTVQARPNDSCDALCTPCVLGAHGCPSDKVC